MALTPGLQLPFGIQPVNPVPVDAWSGPYSGVDESSAISLANSLIPLGIRFQSMEVRLIMGGTSRKYWYRDGVTDSDLVEFSGGGVGSQGAQGSQGSSGPQGPQGVAGQQGSIGSQGDSGPQGVTGLQGAQGVTGLQGKDGYQGFQGDVGPQGFQGATGSQGIAGPQGDVGYQGFQGSKGNTGKGFVISKVYNSDAERLSAIGIDLPGDGEFGLVAGTLPQADPDYGKLYLYTVANGWSYETDLSVQGIQGPQGETGLQGTVGLQGSIGPQGVAGSWGDVGPQGFQGSVGSQGPQGEKGAQGLQGLSGGVSTIIAGKGLSVVTGSNGEVTINLISSGSNGAGDCPSESLFERRQQVVASSSVAGDDVDLGFVIDPVKMSQGRINIYLNGVLQRLGNQYDVYAGSVSSALKFNRDLSMGDLITVHVDPGTSADLVLFQREYYIVDTFYGPDANIELGFIIDSNNFSNGRINVYLNGVLQRSGIDNDVYLGMTATSLRFNSSLEVGDVITVYSDNCITLMPYPYSSIERNYAAIVSFYDPGDDVELGFSIDPHKFEKDLISVYLNGILLRPGQDHDFYLGSTITSLRFTRGIDVGDVIFVQVDHSDGLSNFASMSGDNLFFGNNIFAAGLSGSLQSLANGDPYLVSGQGINIVTGSSGQIVVSSRQMFQWNEKPNGNIDGANDTFKLLFSPSPPESLMVFRDGLLLDSDLGDYAIVGDTITLPVPPPVGTRIKVSYPHE